MINKEVNAWLQIHFQHTNKLQIRALWGVLTCRKLHDQICINNRCFLYHTSMVHSILIGAQPLTLSEITANQKTQQEINKKTKTAALRVWGEVITEHHILTADWLQHVPIWETAEWSWKMSRVKGNMSLN